MSIPHSSTRPHTPPIQLTSVWECASPTEADAILGRQQSGYVYRREGHPNADDLNAACCELHGAAHGVATSSGMAAIAAGALSVLQTGDHVLLSNRLYGKTTYLLTAEFARLGVTHTLLDMRALSEVQSAMQANTRLLIAETIANPRLELIDLAGLAKIAHAGNALLLADNTFASPYVCQPLKLGADLVMESLTKMMSGHSDVLLGWIGCNDLPLGTRLQNVTAAWGFVSHPLDCWLALRSLATFELRLQRCCSNAQQVAEYLSRQPAVCEVDYPGLASHAQHDLARTQFGTNYGCLVTFQLRGGLAAAERFITASAALPFCPSLGTHHSSVSHPTSTSHRAYTEEARAALGITAGTMRLSVGVEPVEQLLAHLQSCLAVAQSAN